MPTTWIDLDRSWTFRWCYEKEEDAVKIDLPHLPWVADLDGHNHRMGLCTYKRTLPAQQLSAGWSGFLHVGAAMQITRVLVDGMEIAHHRGGYLPFEVDVSRWLADGGSHALELQLDNRDAADIPPGRSHATLDFCRYGGLYRNVQLRLAPPVHITEASTAGELASGGIFIQTLEATEAAASILVQVHVWNRSMLAVAVQAEITVDFAGITIARGTSTAIRLQAGCSQTLAVKIRVDRPALWHPHSPTLHGVHVNLIDPNGISLDQATTRFGIRRIGFSRSAGFVINGARWRPRGTNRHQEHPYVGYAVPRAAEFRDAIRIKEAGFDYVRLSHYPQSPHFLDACDELGIVVTNCLPGWQFMGDETFQVACYDHARRLIRRDRNHACVVLWELSLNETMMPEEFMMRLNAIGHEEYPGDQMFTCGWIDRFDVYLHSRQHGEIHRWRNQDKALVIAEYGDWEFYAANAGFNQGAGRQLLADWSNSRKLRDSGECGLLQQAQNHALALNDNLVSPAVCDGQWAMFDYARGYHPQRAAVGVMDIFRLPKFSYHFYRSQRDPGKNGVLWHGGPMVFIASHWLVTSSLEITVYSNCETVELLIDGASLGVQSATPTASTQRLPHPPFRFLTTAAPPGQLKAVGRIKEVAVAHHQVRTPGMAATLAVKLDSRGVSPHLEGDLIFAHALLNDEFGTLCVDQRQVVSFEITGGGGQILGPTQVTTDAGIASTLVRFPRGGGGGELQVSGATWTTQAVPIQSCTIPGAPDEERP
jgi:beta-galactosidase